MLRRQVAQLSLELVPLVGEPGEEVGALVARVLRLFCRRHVQSGDGRGHPRARFLPVVARWPVPLEADRFGERLDGVCEIVELLRRQGRKGCGDARYVCQRRRW